MNSVAVDRSARPCGGERGQCLQAPCRASIRRSAWGARRLSVEAMPQKDSTDPHLFFASSGHNECVVVGGAPMSSVPSSRLTTRVTLSSLSIAITLCATCSFQIYFGGCSLSFDPIIVTLSSLSIAISFLRYMRFPHLLVCALVRVRLETWL